MKASTKNRLEGMYHTLKGTVKEAIGNTLSSPRVALSGYIERAEGRIQANLGKAEKAIGR